MRKDVKILDDHGAVSIIEMIGPIIESCMTQISITAKPNLISAGMHVLMMGLGPYIRVGVADAAFVRTFKGLT